MSVDIREKWLASFDKFSADDRPLNQIANARKGNKASDYDSEEFIDHSTSTIDKRVKSKVAVMVKFTEPKAS